MEKASERIKKVIDYSGVTTNKLSKILGYKSPAKLYYVVSGRNDISRDIMNDIIKLYPEINSAWLLTGEGEMLNHHHNDATNNTNSNNMNSLDSHSQDKINENNIYIEMIATQRELISQYRKEIEYLRRKLKENTENS